MQSPPLSSSLSAQASSLAGESGEAASRVDSSLHASNDESDTVYSYDRDLRQTVAETQHVEDRALTAKPPHAPAGDHPDAWELSPLELLLRPSPFAPGPALVLLVFASCSMSLPYNPFTTSRQ